MIKKFSILTILIFTYQARAYQCNSMTTEKMLNISSYVFTGKVISKNSNTASVDIVKSYKGSLKSKVQISFPGVIAKEYKFLEKLKTGEVYLFSSEQLLKKNTDPIQISECNWFYDIKSAKNTITDLDKKQTSSDSN